MPNSFSIWYLWIVEERVKSLEAVLIVGCFILPVTLGLSILSQWYPPYLVFQSLVFEEENWEAALILGCFILPVSGN